jgi:hypothetical protein
MFCAKGKGNCTFISVYIVHAHKHTRIYVRTVDACVVMCSEDETCQEFTGREQGFEDTK